MGRVLHQMVPLAHHCPYQPVPAPVRCVSGSTGSGPASCGNTRVANLSDHHVGVPSAHISSSSSEYPAWELALGDKKGGGRHPQPKARARVRAGTPVWPQHTPGGDIQKWRVLRRCNWSPQVSSGGCVSVPGERRPRAPERPSCGTLLCHVIPALFAMPCTSRLPGFSDGASRDADDGDYQE